MGRDNDIHETVHNSMLNMLDRMKVVEDDSRYHLMMEWMEVIVDDTEDILTIPQHIRLQEN
tara:strand:+ start:1076 stop:1258 length:183 start_codon:yes stop_codon:yes gene_type:complete